MFTATKWHSEGKCKCKCSNFAGKRVNKNVYKLQLHNGNKSHIIFHILWFSVEAKHPKMLQEFALLPGKEINNIKTKERISLVSQVLALEYH